MSMDRYSSHIIHQEYILQENTTMRHIGDID